MGIEEDFVLPPRSTRRPPTTSATSRASNGSSSTNGSGRGAPRVPIGNPYLQKRILSVEDYADEMRQGGTKHLPVEEHIRLYGSEIVPIPIPLEPGEKEMTHEKRFRGWLAKRRIDVEKETVASERKLRMDFAKFKTRKYDGGRLFKESPRRGKRRRDESDESDEGRSYQDDDEEEEEYRRSYREDDDDQNENDRYDQEEDEFYDDDDEDEAAYSSDDRKDRKVDVKRQRVDNSHDPSKVLLRQRVLSLHQYRIELEREKTRKLTAAERKELYGSTTMPIPVPLHPGETVEEYERAFLTYVSDGHTYPTRFTNAPNAERSARITFARIRAKQQVDEEPTTKPPPVTSILDRIGTIKTVPSELEVKKEVVETPCRTCFPLTCSFVRPSHGSSTATLLRAHLACGCRECFIQCTHRLIDHLEQHEQVERSTKTHEVGSHGFSKRVDVAKMVQLTSLMKSRRIRESTPAPPTRSLENTRDDPTELQLQAQYDEINTRVSDNQHALVNVAAQLQATPVDRVDVAASLQLEKQDFESLVEEEMDHRNAALALLAVYLWRHDKPDLTQRIQNPGVSNVPHVQRVCHQKCATIATELTLKQAQVASLKQELDTVLFTEDGGSDDRRLATLQRVGEQLTQVEQAITTLYAARRREITTLIHFDAHVRELVETLLLEM